VQPVQPEQVIFTDEKANKIKKFTTEMRYASGLSEQNPTSLLVAQVINKD
jgi:hypothetical protein